RPGDRRAVAELLSELNRLQEPWRVFTPRAGLEREQAGRYAADPAAADPDTMHLVAVDEDGEVVGTLFAHVETPSSFSDQRAVELSNVAVRPDRRGRGAGRALVEAATA